MEELGYGLFAKTEKNPSTRRCLSPVIRPKVHQHYLKDRRHLGYTLLYVCLHKGRTMRVPLNHQVLELEEVSDVMSLRFCKLVASWGPTRDPTLFGLCSVFVCCHYWKIRRFQIKIKFKRFSGNTGSSGHSAPFLPGNNWRASPPGASRGPNSCPLVCPDGAGFHPNSPEFNRHATTFLFCEETGTCEVFPQSLTETNRESACWVPAAVSRTILECFVLVRAFLET